ncbi:MAG: heme-copper oxidase subunit III [Bacteroidota bacterium]|nr:heme-copper oxidase subunit III [Bacteroidota bacterium]
MIAVVNEQKNRVHPLKYVLWIGLASIVMMFAGLSSAYIVKRNQANWLTFDIPLIFWYSTAVIVLSSITILLSRKAFLDRNMKLYKRWLGVTLLLGIAFVLMQYLGFVQLWDSGITVSRNVSFSFLYVIVGLHALHVFGGIVALLVIYLRSFRSRIKNYSAVPIDLMNTYWHFVDFLWIYLLIFLVMIR